MWMIEFVSSEILINEISAPSNPLECNPRTPHISVNILVWCAFMYVEI